MDEKIKATIEKIKLLSKQNEEFNQEMQKLFGKTVSASTDSMPNTILDDISAIRSALEIRANVSISYDFVKEQRLRDQLIIDNLRMENAALNLKEPEEDRFYTFCVNAFYQVENIINYYYHLSYPNIELLLSEIEEATKSEKDDFKFKRSGKEQNITSINIVHKINAFCNTLLYDEKTLKWAIGTLRQVRNEGAHRCSIIRKEEDNNSNIYKFLKNNTFNSVRIYLKQFVNTIKKEIQEPTKEEEITVVITSKLPSACYISMKGSTIELPNKFLSKVKALNNGDELRVKVLRNRIIDVIENSQITQNQ